MKYGKWIGLACLLAFDWIIIFTVPANDLTWVTAALIALNIIFWVAASGFRWFGITELKPVQIILSVSLVLLAGLTIFFKWSDIWLGLGIVALGIVASIISRKKK